MIERPQSCDPAEWLRILEEMRQFHETFGFCNLAELHTALTSLHGHPAMLSSQCTGAAMGFGAFVGQVPGASRTVINADTPYFRECVRLLLRYEPDKSVAATVAVDLAMAAWESGFRMVRQAIPAYTPPIYGLGLTAAIATDRTRKGRDEVHIAVSTQENPDATPRILSTHFIFERGKFTREQQNYLCQLLALNLLFCAIGLPQVEISEKDFPGLLVSSDKLMNAEDDGFTLLPATWNPAFQDLVIDPATLMERPLFWADGRRGRGVQHLDPKTHVLIPTSAYPLSWGHRAMAEAIRRQGFRPVFLIEAEHPDKGPIPTEQLVRRVEQFRGRETVMLTTGVGLYLEKMMQFPGFIFAIGTDVKVKMLDPKYGITPDLLRKLMKRLGSRCFVFSRGAVEVSTVSGPTPSDPLFQDLAFNVNISSTRIREALEMTDRLL